MTITSLTPDVHSLLVRRGVYSGDRLEMEKIKAGIPATKYARIHYWLRETYGKASKCEGENCKGVSDRYEWAKKRECEYDFKRENFLQLCKSCHSSLDCTEETRKLLTPTHCIHGHEFTEENIYWRDEKHRMCKICRMARIGPNRKQYKYLTYKGDTYTLAEWSRRLGIKYETIYWRLKRGWSAEEIFEMPITKSNRIKKPST